MGDLDQYEVKDDLSQYEVQAEGPPKEPKFGSIPKPNVQEVADRLAARYGPAFGFMAGGGINTLGETGALKTAAETIKGIATGPKVKAVAKVGAQDLASHIPAVGRLVRRPSIGDYIEAIRTKAPEAAPAASTLTPTQEWWKARGGTLAAERPSGPVRSPRPTPSVTPPEVPMKVEPAEGAGAPIPTEATIAPKPNTSPKQVESLLSQGMGGKSLLPDVPLRKQVPTAAPPAAEAPSAHIPVESSAMKSFKYDPVAKELEVRSPSGAISIHGDVSPEQAQAFQEAPSKGKAWNELKKNSTYVGKIVNGKRINIKPPKAMGSASPDDLTDILTESVKQARQR